MDIDILKAKRKSLRAAFTVCCNGISNRIETLGNNEVNALYKKLQDKFSRLETTQEEISETSQEKTILVLEENIAVEKRKFKLPKLELRK
ncbi:hypothetical protein TNCV_154691 [Trichonephila clavipes]|uniref:Uncharacterized protein n=1 Tax=Trichonephila clavipes TaxID=2585209 RepID=A0A8X6WIS6_TRICX|nr:hypothetical protein TNCV_154691 [Trichonephila clavipes]